MGVKPSATRLDRLADAKNAWEGLSNNPNCAIDRKVREYFEKQSAPIAQ